MNKEALHICFIVNDYIAGIKEPEQLLDELFSLTEWTEALHRQGCKITAFLRFTKEASLERKGIDYIFIKDPYGPQLKFWQIAPTIHLRALAIQPDILHTHNFNKILQHRDLLRRTNIPLVIQNHAETPRYWIREQLQKKIFKKAALFLLAAKGQEAAWVKKNIIRQDQVRFVMEGSVHFQKTDRETAQQKTGLRGDPVCLWVGNLNTNKDPLTILEGFRRIWQDYPQARLYMIYRFDDLMEQVQAFLEKHADLKKAVILLGRKQRIALEAYYNSAHYFVLGSHQEGSGYSALEAMACGCVPILTQIPSFQAMTNQGQIGQLWNCGSPDSFESALRAALARDWATDSEATKAYFDTHWSYAALSQRLIAYYKELL